jgi:hypothetical protein
MVEGLSMKTRERSERDADVIAARARGLSWREVSRRFDISDRHCRRIVAEYRESGPKLHEVDPVEVIEDALASYDAAIEDFALLAEQTGHDGTRLGAIRGRLEATSAKLGLMTSVGVLPRNLGRLAVEIDVRKAAATAIDVLDRNGIPPEVQQQLAEALQGRNGRS